MRRSGFPVQLVDGVLQETNFGFEPEIAFGPRFSVGTSSAKAPDMMRTMTWAIFGAVIAVGLGHQFELYGLNDLQALIAAAIGATLGAIAYGGENETSFVMRPFSIR
jgi:hypothetical protein